MTVVKFPGATVENTLDAAKQANLKSVLVLGFDKDDTIYADGTTMNASDAIYVMEILKHSIMAGET